MVHIILEGCDLSGKSTVANWINDVYSEYNIIRNGKPENVECFFHQCDKSLMALKGDEPVILDRLPPISNWVYKPIFNHYYGMPEYRVIEWCARIPRDNVVLFWLDLDEDTLQKRFLERGDKYLDFEQIMEASRRYKMFFDIYRAKYLNMTLPRVSHITSARTVSTALQTLQVFRDLDEIHREVKKTWENSIR